MLRHLLDSQPGPCDGHRCSGHSGKLVAHGWVNAVTWGIVIPTAILVPHLFRSKPGSWWFHLHRALAVAGLVLAIVGAALGGNLQNDDYHQSKGGSAHKALGILAVVCLALQAVTPVIWRPLKTHKWRAAWNTYHHWLGRLAVAFGFVAAFLGIYIASVGWGYYVAFAGVIAVFLLCLAVGDAVRLCQGHKLQSSTLELAHRKGTVPAQQAHADENTAGSNMVSTSPWIADSGGVYPHFKAKQGQPAQSADEKQHASAV